MNLLLYDAPMKIELKGHDIYVNEVLKKNIRYLSAMSEVFKEIIDIDALGNLEMYYMFRRVYTTNGICYDITLLPPLTIDEECNKTYGHYHQQAENGMSYPEIYHVLEGNAVFILQKKNRDASINAHVIKATKGEVIFIPPNYGHVTVNPSKEILLLSNTVADGPESDYSEYKKERGAAIYYTVDGNILQNNNYVIKEIERTNVKKFNKKFNFVCDDLLVQFYNNPEKFEFLKKPSLLLKNSK